MRTQEVEIAAAVRSAAGKSAARRLRAQQRIPAVVYGRGLDTIPIAVDRAAFTQAAPEGAWLSTLFRLQIEGMDEGDNAPTCMVKEVQQDLVRQQVLCIDFHRISLHDMLEVQIPLTHVGESPGAKQGGVIQQVLHEIVVECLPTEIPEYLEVDISSLEIGESARAGEVPLPADVKLITPAEEVVLLVAPPQAEEEEPAAPEETEELLEDREEPEVIGEKAPETEEESA